MVDSVISQGNAQPGTFIKLSLGVGPQTPGGPRKVLLYGNMTSGGTAAAEKKVEVFSEDDARTKFGAGSELFLMARAAIEANPEVPLYAIPVTESGGTASTGDITVAGTASSGGTVAVDILGERIYVPFANTDVASAVAQAIVDKINEQTDWPVTAAVNGVTPEQVDITAKHKGPRGDYITMRSEVIEGSGITTSDSGTALTGGATTDDPQTALDNVASERHFYHVAPYEDATELGKYQTHVESQAEPTIGKREMVVASSRDTLANTKTLTAALNAALMQVVWHYGADDTPAMIAAAIASRRARQEGIDTAYNFDGEGLRAGTSSLPIKPQNDAANKPEDSEIRSALNSGITPLQTADDGSVGIVRSITTRHQDASSNPDFRVRDSHKVTVAIDFADTVDVGIASRFGSMKADDNPPQGETPPPGVCVPKMVREYLFSVQGDFEGDGKLQNVDEHAAELAVELSKSPEGRFNIVAPIDVIEHAHQFSVDVRQVG